MPLNDVITAFSGNPLDRADLMRTDPELMGAKMQAEGVRVALMAGDAILTDIVGDILWQSPRKLRFLPVQTSVFLGLDRSTPCYAAHLVGAPEDFDNMFEDGKFRDGRACALKLGKGHPSLGIYAQAKSMLLWHESHCYCAKCGHESTLVKAGYERLCPACNASHFPRTDPVVIMMALHDGKALFGRNYNLPPGMYSALAGFVEPGETLEEAVARELYEEAGVKATRVRYVTSQPWPWPSSMMIGMIADIESPELTLDKTEIEDAGWYSREQVLEGLKGSNPDFMLPPAVRYCPQSCRCVVRRNRLSSLK